MDAYYGSAWMQLTDANRQRAIARRPLIDKIRRDSAEAERHRAEAERCKAEIQDLLEVCRDTLPLNILLQIKKGHFWADLVIMGSRYYSEEDRMEAVERLLSNYFKIPIHPKRWEHIGPTVIQEIAREAAAHKVSWEEELHWRERAALHAVAEEAVGDLKLRQQKRAIRSVWAAFGNAFTEDVLGSDWRKKPKQQEFEDKKHGELTLDKKRKKQALDSRELELDLILRGKKLTEREAELFLLRRAGFSYEELAARLSVSPNALRTAHHRTIEKLKKLVS